MNFLATGRVCESTHHVFATSITTIATPAAISRSNRRRFTGVCSSRFMAVKIADALTSRNTAPRLPIAGCHLQKALRRRMSLLPL
jgi:hypothetical protein